jgi:alcohol dehydrogenase (cytochrome c)
VRTAILSFCVLFPSVAGAQSPGPGQQVFVSRCASCHGSDGNGGELGPSIVDRVPARTDEDLAALFKQGLPAAGMPAFPNLTATESADLIRYVRTLRRREGSGPVRTKLTLVDGSAIEGLVLNQSALDLQLLGDDRKGADQAQSNAGKQRQSRPTHAHGNLPFALRARSNASGRSPFDSTQGDAMPT